MLQSLNERAFLLLNASADPAAETVALARFAADWLLYAAPAVLVGLWVWGRAGNRGALLAIVAATLLALGINQLVGLLWYEPRPFMVGLGTALVAHAPENSFPSDHATFMWSVGLGLIATAAARTWGALVCLLGLCIAWARIFVGLHFPLDMAGSLVVALGAAGAAKLLCSPARRWALPATEFIYFRVLDLVHLPSAVFPREKGA